MEPTNDDATYRRAKERVEELKGLYVHLAIYLIVNLGLFLIDLSTGGGWWFFWPLLGWGVGMAIHAFVVLAAEGPLGRNWEQRKIRELMEREHGSGQA